MKQAYNRGVQQALWLLKLAAFDPGQLELLQRHWPGMTPEKLLELNRARALALPAPESARVLERVNLRRAAEGVPTTPWTQRGWLSGTAETVPLRGATPKEEFLNRLFGPPAPPTPAPAPVQSLAPYRADIPAAQPLTRQQRLYGVPVPTAASASQVSHISNVVPATEGTSAAAPRALRAVRRLLGHKMGLG